MGVATTRMSSRGQVVIPEGIRDSLGLRKGTRFVVMGHRNTVVLKPVDPPSLREFNEVARKVRAAARKSGLTRSDLRSAIRKARRRP